MRHPLHFLVAASLGLAPAASAVTFTWVNVGDPGNACDDEPLQGCFGAVDYLYRIAKYEVTNVQDTAPVPGGIARSGSPGSYTLPLQRGLRGVRQLRRT